jgi:hypothetical protein
MKDWLIDKSMLPRKYLVHIHSKTKEDCTKIRGGYWVCMNCLEFAPEEIGFIADLAECYIYHTKNYFDRDW